MLRFTVDELERRIDEVLFYKWDPIGVNHYPTARAEYRSYVSVILSTLQSGDSKALYLILSDIQTSNMGLELDEKLTQATVDLLISHKEAIENQLA